MPDHYGHTKPSRGGGGGGARRPAAPPAFDLNEFLRILSAFQTPQQTTNDAFAQRFREMLAQPEAQIAPAPQAPRRDAASYLVHLLPALIRAESARKAPATFQGETPQGILAQFLRAPRTYGIDQFRQPINRQR